MEYNQLKASIAAVIKTNNRKEITGQLLQNVLFQMTNVIGENLQLAGFATPLTDPHEPDQNLFYITDQGGVYPHFDNLTVDDGLTFLMWKNGEWTSHTVGVVTQEWVDSHYVSIDFFRSLFRAYDSAGLEILPNNNPEEALPTVVDNIKAMVGFWTEQYISALGQQTGGGGGGGATSLDELSDVFLTNPSLGQALVFTITPDHPEGIWVNQTIQAGTDMATVWAALAGNTTQQINISHLTDALADYATKTYVDQNFITVAYFDRLFRAYNGNTLVSHNDVTSTIDNIKAMFGFWTEQYLSALGNNSGGGGQLLALSNMADVTLTTPIADKQVLTFDAVSGKWVNGNAQAGATALANLTDVTLTSLQTNQILIYDATTQKWVNSSVKTINGYSIFGTGDIPASGGGGGNYLPLAGGTMTGTIFYSGVQTLIVGESNSYSDTRYGTIMGGSSASTYNASYMAHHCKGNGSSSNYLTFGLYGADELMNILGNGKVGIGTSTPTARLTVLTTEGYVGSFYSTDAYDTYIQFYKVSGSSTTMKAEVGHSHGLSFISNQPNGARIGVNDNGTPQYWTAWNGSQYEIITSRGGTINGSLTIIGRTPGTNGDLVVANTSLSAQIAIGYDMSEYRMGFIQFNQPTVGAASASNSIRFHIYGHDNLLNIFGNGNVGIGTTSPSYTLHVAGTIYATGAMTALSDARKKDIQGEPNIRVEQIAHAPAVQFLWKDKERRKDGLQVGTLAQYWRTVLPEVVSDKGGELSMQYGVAALVSSIIIARKVADHEVRIEKMEKWMKKWAEENDE